MLFVKSDNLKVGMRLARPIYNKSGVLLYERDSKLTQQGVTSIRNFNLIGIFILEPAEPVPPMTEEDIAFERFQTMAVFALKEELDKIIKERKITKISSIASDIIRNYGRTYKKINFIQNLRSTEDFAYKHSLNVGILCALMSYALSMKMDEQIDTVITALVHNIGEIPNEEHVHPPALFEQAFPYSKAIKHIWMQFTGAMKECEEGKLKITPIDKAAQVLLVAEIYDTMTAMKFNGEPASEVRAIKTLLNHPDVFEPKVVAALISTISILSPGTCIELETKETGLVLESNPKDILSPRILNFKDNQIIDLGENKDFKIKDIMKTLDNRYLFNVELLKKYGYVSEQTDYVCPRDDS